MSKEWNTWILRIVCHFQQKGVIRQIDGANDSSSDDDYDKDDDDDDDDDDNENEENNDAEGEEEVNYLSPITYICEMIRCSV